MELHVFVVDARGFRTVWSVFLDFGMLGPNLRGAPGHHLGENRGISGITVLSEIGSEWNRFKSVRDMFGGKI